MADPTPATPVTGDTPAPSMKTTIDIGMTDDRAIKRLFSRLKNGKKMNNKTTLTYVQPIVVRKNLRTSIVNTREIVQHARRTKEQLMEFMVKLMSLGSGRYTFDSEGNIKLTGYIDAKRLIDAVEQFTRQCVTCGSCRSINTEQVSEGKNQICICLDCGEKNIISASGARR